VGPSQTNDIVQLTSVQHPVDQPRCEAVATADAIEEAELTGRRDGPLPVESDHGSPLMAVGGLDLPEGRGHHFDVGEVAVDRSSVLGTFRIETRRAGFEPRPFLSDPSPATWSQSTRSGHGTHHHSALMRRSAPINQRP
jgi:hypothetical protein